MEDSADVRRAMRIIFEAAGYRVSEAASLAEARSETSVAMPDVILLDLRLPDGEGLDLLPALAPRTAARPVLVALTGRDDPQVSVRCRELGCHEVLLKPVPPRELVRRIGELLA